MFTEQIERMKRQYTDKYVMVDGTRPELARFRDTVGRVKTVNMNGRVLVEFDDYHLNVGWYDIDPEFLKVVDKPPPKAPKPEVKKPAAKAEAKPAATAKPPLGRELGAERQAAKAPAAGAKAVKPSVADILAAARAGKGEAPAAKSQAEAAPAVKSAADTAAKPQAAPKVDRSKMSVADMLAAARAGGAPGAAPAKTQAEQAPPHQQAVTQEAAAEQAPAGEVAAATGKTIKRVDKSNMSIDDILAYCRQHDAK